MANTTTKKPVSLKKFTGNGDIWSAIRRLGGQIAKELTDKEIFQSAVFYNYARNLADFLLRKHKLYALKIYYDTSSDAPVAYTDGKDIVLNAGNCLAAKPKLLEGRFKVNMGVLFHECAHKLFLDFDIHNKGMDSLRGGNLYGEFDVPAGSDLETNLDELKQAITSYKNSIASVYQQVQNIISDGHDEAAMKQCFPGFVARCIDTAGLVQQEHSTSLAENVANSASPLSIYFSLILQYAKFGYCNLGEENADTEPYTQTLARMEPVIDAALEEHNYKKRWDHINLLVLHLWPVIRDVLEQSENDSSSGGGAGGAGGGGQNPLTDEAAKQLLEALANAANADNSAAPAPSGTGHSISPNSVAGQGNPGGEQELGAMLNELGTEKAKDAVQKELDQAQRDLIRGTNMPTTHKGVSVSVKRHHDQNKEAYDEIFDEVKPYVRNLISEIVALLREFNEEALQRHRRYGPIIEATESYRPDGAFFAKKKLPEDRPNMAMCVLVDESGSMGGYKLEMAKKAMVMLEQFATGVGVPLMVAGHCVRHRGVDLNIYKDYVSARPEQDRYALAAIDSGGCNRDGLPLRLCAEMLAQRPEEIRLLVVISDGRPNDDDYSGQTAYEDIQNTVAEFRRKGLLIYGAAIDEDREVIQELYGKGFLSIQDLKSLPKTMVRLLRQNII